MLFAFILFFKKKKTLKKLESTGILQWGNIDTHI